MGQDKRWIQWQGRPLIDVAIDLAKSATGLSPVLVGDTFPEPSYQDCRIISDAALQKGPLGGIVSALRDCQSDRLLVLPVDMPLLQTEDLEALDRSSNSDAAVIAVNNQIYPLPVVIKTSTLPVWEGQLKEGRFSLLDTLNNLKVRRIDYTRRKERLLNVNSPGNLEE